MKRTVNYDGLHPVVMLVRNALELTQQAVDSVLKQDVPVILHIIDNDSTDGTSLWLEEHPEPNLYGETFRPALGVSSGWNYGISRALKNSDHVFVVNNDVLLRPDTLRALLEDGGDFVTAVSVDNPGGAFGEWRKAPRPHPDFSCYLIRKAVWKTVGMFDESMALYASDADYHLRMHQAGIEAYTIGIPFYHYASGTLKFAKPTEKSRIQRQADKDRKTFEEKWGCEVGSTEYYSLFGHGAPDEKETNN